MLGTRLAWRLTQLQAVAKVRLLTKDCEAAAWLMENELGSKMPGGRIADIGILEDEVFKGVGGHRVYINGGTIYDPTGLEFVKNHNYWKEAQLKAAGLLDAAKSGIFTTEEYARFLTPFGTPPHTPAQ